MGTVQSKLLRVARKCGEFLEPEWGLGRDSVDAIVYPIDKTTPAVVHRHRSSTLYITFIVSISRIGIRPNAVDVNPLNLWMQCSARNALPAMLASVDDQADQLQRSQLSIPVHHRFS